MSSYSSVVVQYKEVPVEKEVIVEKIVIKEVDVIIHILLKHAAFVCDALCIDTTIACFNLPCSACCRDLPSFMPSHLHLHPLRQVPVEIRVPVTVEKVVERTVVQEVEVIREVPVPIEKIVERVVTKEVHIHKHRIAGQ